MIAEEIGQEAFNLICGKKIGGGMSRQVYECKLKPGYVVKVEVDPYPNYQNLAEWHIWNAVRETKYSRWFAGIDSISPDGKMMIQEMTRPAGRKEVLSKVPAFFCDLKLENWGMTTAQDKARFVCHDYGVSRILEQGLHGRLKKPDWVEHRGD